MFYLIVLSRDPAKVDTYQEFYFLYPKLNIGFIVIGKTIVIFQKSFKIFQMQVYL